MLLSGSIGASIWAAAPLEGIVISGQKSGIYSFTPGYEVQSTLVMELPDPTVAAAAGDYADGFYRYMDFRPTSTGVSSATWHILDLDRGTETTVAQTDGLAACTDITYDVTSGKFYGSAYLVNGIIELDPATGNPTGIASTPGFLALACNSAGELFGIALDNSGEASLYAVDKLTGNVRLIGDTGVKCGFYLQSATFDRTDGRLYWVTYTAQGASQLYRVNTTTGIASYLATFDGGDQYVGLFSRDSALDPAVPAAVTDLVASADPSGALTGTVSFTAPRLTVGGSSLDAITSIDIYRGASKTPLHSWTAPEPGASLSWTDPQALPGINSYRICASNAAGAGMNAYASFFAGIDVPDRATDLSVAISADGQPALSWTAPSRGINGAPLLSSQLSYNIDREVAGRVERVASGVSGTAWTDASLSVTGQQYVSYTVTAVTSGGEGRKSASAGVIAGAPYKLPYTESFADASITAGPWISQAGWGNASWEVHYLSQFPANGPADDDEGMAVFRSFTKADGSEARLIGPALDFTGVQYPQLDFEFFHYYLEDTPVNDHIVVECSLDGQTFAPVGTVHITDGDKMWWTPVCYSLAAYAGKPRVYIAFRGVAEHPDELGYDLSVDNIRVTAGTDAGIADAASAVPAFTAVAGPGTVTIDNPASLPVTLTNLQGTALHTTTASAATVHGLAPGLYLLHAPGHTLKLIVP